MLKYQHEQRLESSLGTRDGDILRRPLPSRNAVFVLRVPARSLRSHIEPCACCGWSRQCQSRNKSQNLPIKRTDWRPASYTVKKATRFIALHRSWPGLPGIGAVEWPGRSKRDPG